MKKIRMSLQVCALVLGFGLLGPLLALFGAPRGDAAPWLLIAPPWADPSAIAIAAGGWPVGFDTAPLAVFAQGADNFDENARAKGAWFILRAGVLAQICGVQSV